MPAEAEFDVAPTGPAARRWAELLAGWAVPDEILAAAPESPWGFPTALWTPPAEPEDSPSRRAALALLGDGGTVADIGCGGGAAALALVPPARSLIGVDDSAGMLEVFAAGAEARAVAHREIHGSWPAVAGEVEAVDLVVCHHVLYNVSALAPFVGALTATARRGVVVELGGSHPLLGLAPLWRRFWDLDRPEGPRADDAVAVLRELGIDPVVEVAERARLHWASPAEEVAFARKRLCLPASRDGEVAEALAELPRGPRPVVTVWWRP